MRLRASHHDALDPGLLGSEPLDGVAHRLDVRVVHRVRRRVRVVQGERHDARIVLPLDHAANLSMIVATPMPPPTHRVASPYRSSRRSSSSSNVPISIAPVAPSG